MMQAAEEGQSRCGLSKVLRQFPSPCSRARRRVASRCTAQPRREHCCRKRHSLKRRCVCLSSGVEALAVSKLRET
eukprot:521177-Rhodomonas_salina.1